MRFLPSADIRAAGNYFSRQPSASNNVVPGDVVYMCPEKRSKRLGPSKSIRPGKLSDSMDVLA